MLISILWILFFSTFCKGEESLLGKCLNECGLDPSFFDQKSVGRWSASLPFVGQIRVSIPECNFISTCTTSIIGQKFTISGNHCVKINIFSLQQHCPSVDFITLLKNYDKDGNLLPDKILFIVVSNVTEIEDTTDTYKIKKYHYITDGRFLVDMVMFELDDSIDFTLDRRAVCLFSSYVPVFGNHLHFAGFGRTFTDELGVSRWPKNGDKLVSTNYVHRVLLTVQSYQVCEKATTPRVDNYICVGTNGTGLTIGDNGGGAYVRHNGRFFAVGVACEAGVKQEDEFGIFTGRHIRLDVLVKITPDICKSIREKSGNTISCMDHLENPSKNCEHTITSALEEAQQTEGKIDEPKTKQNQTEGQFVIHTDDENLKRFTNFIQSNQSKNICDVFQLKPCFKFGHCFIHCKTGEGQCESPESINKSFYDWIRTTIWFNKFCLLQHKQSCGKGYFCDELNECKKSKKHSIFGEW